jgi:DNA-3-methyladenine glycosylase II
MQEMTLHDEKAWREARRYLCRQDPVLGEVVKRVGALSAPLPRRTRFESLAHMILGQQISIQAAATVRRRLRARLGGRLSASKLLQLEEDGYRDCGVSRQKREYLQDLARRYQNRDLKLRSIHRLDDESVIEHLIQVKGIGRWTGEMFLLFVLGRPDVLSVGDLGLQNAVRKLYKLKERPSPKHFTKLAETWRPWRSVACWYLWSSLGGPMV